jgi:hypothetical protein
MERAMIQDTGGAKFMRGLVKFIFIICYVAFMWASIHHVAEFFQAYEGSSDVLGSYLLAIAFDVTALVATIAVMFFRKSMPLGIQIIIWLFIAAITAYSFSINWQYAVRHADPEWTMHPTGRLIPVFDADNQLQYVPEMEQNLTLMWINPILASGFTIFALIYSIVGEFFGSKPPSLQELEAKKKYLEETQSIKNEIKNLEESQKGKSIIQMAKEKALEGKQAWQELNQKEETTQEPIEKPAGQKERNTDELEALTLEETTEETPEEIEKKPEGNTLETEQAKRDIDEGKLNLTEQEKMLAFHYENCLSWMATSGSTVPLKQVSETMKVTMKLLRNRVETKQIRATRNKDVVYKDSVVAWAMSEIVPRMKPTHLPTGKPEEIKGENGQENDAIKLEKTVLALQEKTEITDEQLAEILGVSRPAKARFWRLKAEESIRV